MTQLVMVTHRKGSLKRSGPKGQGGPASGGGRRRLAPVLLLGAPSILGSEAENQHMPLAPCCRFCSEPLPVTRSPVSRLRERELFCISFDKQGCRPCSRKRVFSGACVLQLAPDLDILFLWAGQFHKHRFVQRRQPIKNICRVNKNQGR